MTLSPCLDCGIPADGTRCTDCTRVEQRTQPDRKGSAAARGYDWTWDQLSRRARRLQPFCTDCGATTDLQADHSPEAWRRKAAGLPLRLRDIDVVCGYHNRLRGAQRPNQTAPGGIPAGHTSKTHAPESNFASHMLGSLSAAHDDVSGRRYGRPCGRVDEESALVDVDLRKGTSLPVRKLHLCVTNDPSCICHVSSVS